MQKALFAFAALAATALVACSSDNSTDSSAAATAVPGPGDFKADYKSSSAFFTNMSAPVKGTSPHGVSRIWYSSNIKELVGKDSFTAPEGTVSIKEFDMMGDGTKTGIAVMIKKPAGYDTANGDWYYDMRDMKGNVMPDPPAGKIAMCIQCHTGNKATDGLAGTKMK